MNASPDNPNAGLASKPAFVFTLAALTSISAITIDLSLPALPATARALSTSLPDIQAVVGLYIAGFGLGQLPAGLMADRVGRRPVLLVGLALFTLAGIVSGLANSAEVLIGARFAQGFGAATAAVLSRAIVRDVAHGAQAARLMSLMIMLVTVAPLFAPTIGGMLVEVGGWRSPFIASAFLGVAAAALIVIYLPDTHRRGARVPSMGRQLADSLRGFFSEAESVFGLVLLMLLSVGFMALIAGASTVVMDSYGFSPSQFGLIFAVAGFAFLVGSLTNRALVHRLSIMTLTGVGVVITGLCGAALLTMNAMAPVSIIWFWGAISAYMFGVALIMPNATTMALERIPHMAGAGASILGTLQGVVGSIGAVTGAALYDGSISAVAIMLGVSGLACTAAYFALKSWATRDDFSPAPPST